MTYLFGYGHFSVQELRKRVGNLSQIAGIRPYQFSNGRAAGVKALEIYTGSGLLYSILVDRSMDIYEASFKGIPLAWLSPVGVVSPSFYRI